MVKLTVRADQSVEASWAGPKGGGSLYMHAATANAELVNKLDKDQLWACFITVRSNPFFMGNHGEYHYRQTLAKVKAGDYPMPPKFAAAELGLVRKAYIEAAGEGMNAPHDNYLRIAVAALESADTGKAVVTTT